MSWVKDDCVSSLQLLSIKDVKTESVPQHVAIIMDGNRRYAKNNNMNTCEGHCLGFVKLSETLKWCLELGIRELTVYGFSIENLKRSAEELEGHYRIAQDKFQRLMDDADKMKEWGVRVHFVGRLSLLSDEVRRLVSRAMISTRHNDKLRLNIAYYYTGRDEISRAASDLVDAVNSKQITAEDIDETLLSHTMELGEPELLIRTSGVARLSDFLLWQISNTVLYFTDELWPEFTLRNFLDSIEHFQKYAPAAKKTETLSDTKLQFIADLETQRWKNIEKFAIPI